jgi:hypothetical protein
MHGEKSVPEGLKTKELARLIVRLNRLRKNPAPGEDDDISRGEGKP